MPDRDAPLRQIKDLLGPSGLIEDPAGMQPHLVSWRNGWEGKAPFIALPATTEQVRAILSICHAGHICIVPQGGNTGLSAAAIPSARGDQIVINLSRMNKIRNLDPIGATVTVEAGVVLQGLHDIADQAGFLFPLSIAAQGTAQIGGLISTNAGGTAVVRYGNMRELVMGVEAVLPDGEIFSGLRKLPKDNAGYNLSQYFIGSEGTFGVVTAATLRLFPRLSQTTVGFVALKGPEEAMQLFTRFRSACDEHLDAFELMSHAALGLVIKHIPGSRMPCRDDAPYYALIELGSTSSHIPLREIFEAELGAGMERGFVLDAVIAENGTQAKAFWALRENCAEAARKEGPGVHFDISVPLESLAEFLETVGPRVTALVPGSTLVPFGHAGDGNIHYNLSLPQVTDDQARRAVKKQVEDLIYDEVIKRGGSISAEHGIGIERKAELLRYKAPTDLLLMKAIRAALDPSGIMNPGKIFDT